MIRFAFLVYLFFSLSCCNLWPANEKDKVKLITGNWLILFPEHHITSIEQRNAYSSAQDSIVGLFGLKMIRFLEGGTFYQVDSIFKKAGNWHFNPDNRNLFIRNAGKGFDFFKGTYSGISQDTMKIEEMVRIDGQEIRLTWFLKRITDKERTSLFTTEGNWWRGTSNKEGNGELKKRIKAILDYYALYYEMISKESAYFSQSRVFLPFSYYQHSMELNPFSETSGFNLLFQTPQQAKSAYDLLAAAFKESKRKPFPAGQDFVIEYALFIRRIAGAIQ